MADEIVYLETEYALEVKDALGHWCRLRDTKPSDRLMRLHLEVIWGKDVPWDGIRIVKLKKTEALMDMETFKNDTAHVSAK